MMTPELYINATPVRRLLSDVVSMGITTAPGGTTVPIPVIAPSPNGLRRKIVIWKITQGTGDPVLFTDPTHATSIFLVGIQNYWANGFSIPSNGAPVTIESATGIWLLPGTALGNPATVGWIVEGYLPDKG